MAWKASTILPATLLAEGSGKGIHPILIHGIPRKSYRFRVRPSFSQLLRNILVDLRQRLLRTGKIEGPQLDNENGGQKLECGTHSALD